MSSSSGLYTGGYTVTRTSLDEYGGDINTNGELSLNLPIEGVINTEGDQDWFRISLAAGERLVLEAMGSSTNNGTLRDPWLGVYSSSGQLLVSDNNGGRGLDSRLSWAAPTAGTYYVAAGSLGNQGRGSYVIRARRKEDDAPDRLSSAFSYAMVSPGLSVTGDLEVRSDHDWFQPCCRKVTTASASVASAASTATMTLWGPSPHPAHAAGVAIDFDDDSGKGLNANYAKQHSRFYLEAQDATDRYDGHYRLSIEAETMATRLILQLSLAWWKPKRSQVAWITAEIRTSLPLHWKGASPTALTWLVSAAITAASLIHTYAF